LYEEQLEEEARRALVRRNSLAIDRSLPIILYVLYLLKLCEMPDYDFK
jgi:hypothetical protein